MRLIMVLDDGETYSGLDGCQIIALPDELDLDDVEEHLDAAGADDFVVGFKVEGDAGWIVAYDNQSREIFRL